VKGIERRHPIDAKPYGEGAVSHPESHPYHHPDGHGGSAQNTLLTCLALVETYDIVLAFGPTTESRMTDRERRIVEKGIARLKSKGGRVAVVPGLFRRLAPFHDLLAFFRLLRWFRREAPAIVHTLSSKAGLLGRWAARMAGVPIIIHTPHGHVFHGHFGAGLSRLFLVMERLSDRVTDHLVCLTQGELGDYVRLSVAGPGKTSVIHSGVDLQRFRTAFTPPTVTRNRVGIDARALVVGTVGWLLPIKGPEVLLDAMTLVWEHRPDIELVYVGKGDLEESLRARVRQMDVAHLVHFVGWRNDIPDLMHSFDLFVLPSRNEGMGRVVVEAMAAGLPVVASCTGGLPDLVADGQNGLLVPPGDAPSLGRAILKLSDRPDLRQRMGDESRRRAEAFSLEQMVDKLDALYGRLLN